MYIFLREKTIIDIFFDRERKKEIEKIEREKQRMTDIVNRKRKRD